MRFRYSWIICRKVANGGMRERVASLRFMKRKVLHGGQKKIPGSPSSRYQELKKLLYWGKSIPAIPNPASSLACATASGVCLPERTSRSSVGLLNFTKAAHGSIGLFEIAVSFCNSFGKNFLVGLLQG